MNSNLNTNSINPITVSNTGTGINTTAYGYGNYITGGSISNNSLSSINYNNGIYNDETYITNTITNVDSITLVDEKDGSHWKLKMSGGELVVEPLDKNNIRKLKIKKVLESE